MLIANFVFLVVGLGGAKLFSRVTLIPRTILWPAVFIFSMIGSYAHGQSVFDVWVMLGSGLVGYLMLRHGFGPAPLVMGLILGQLVEENLSQAMIILDNNPLRMLESPIVVSFLILTIISLFWTPIISLLSRAKNS